MRVSAVLLVCEHRKSLSSLVISNRLLILSDIPAQAEASALHFGFL